MAQEMLRAGVLAGPQQIVIKEVPVPEVGTGQIKIKVSACGVYRSDIHMWKAGALITARTFSWDMNSAAL